jgi:hypothetical protein
MRTLRMMLGNLTPNPFPRGKGNNRAEEERAGYLRVSRPIRRAIITFMISFVPA